MTDVVQRAQTQGGRSSRDSDSFAAARTSWRVDPITASRSCESSLGPGEIPPLGAHVVTSRLGYTHHGIHVGRGRVVHYSGLSRGWRGGPVEEVTLAEFARGRPIRIRVHASTRFDREAVIARARSRLGENRYRALSNNCEHLCEWAIHGENRSRQVELLRLRWRRSVEAASQLVRVPLRLLSLGHLSARRSVPCDAC